MRSRPRRFGGQPEDLVVALLPSLAHIMLAVFVVGMGERGMMT